MKPISLIIPAHNEGAQMEEIARRLVSDYRLGQLADFIFVVDGCAETREAIGRAIPKGGAKILFFGNHMGKGRAVWEGFSASRSEYVGFLDADESISLEEVGAMCSQLVQENSDCLIASRTKIRGRGAMRSIPSAAFNFLVRLLFPLDLPDTQCGFKLFRKSVLGQKPLTVEGYAFDVELLLRVIKVGGKIEAYPLESTERKGGQFSLLATPAMLLDVVRLRLFS